MSKKEIVNEGFSNEKELQEHVRKFHGKTPIGDYLAEIVYGGNDGIVTTLAVIAGFGGAGVGGVEGVSVVAVLLFAFANLFADGTSMGLGNFLSIRSSQESYKKSYEREKKEVEGSPEAEWEETIFLLKRDGFSQEDAEKIAEIFSRNKTYWVEFMMEKELDMHDPTNENPWFNGIATFTSFVTFGFVPIIPYLVVSGDPNVFLYSIFFAFLALISLGVLRWKVTRENLLKALFETVLVGGVSTSVAFLVGLVFGY